MNSERPSSEKLDGMQSNTLTVPHRIFDRNNGCSPPPFNSLNVSYSVGDHPDNVKRNRLKIKNLLGVQLLASAGQVHSDRVYVVDRISRDIEVEGFDALITGQAGIGLLIQQADCQAILLHDMVQNVIAAIHCGWRGNVVNIIGKTLDRMRMEFTTSPAAIQAVISPSLGPCCGEFTDYRQQLPGDFQKFITTPNHLDFQAISRNQLINAGVPAQNIDILRICTVCNRNFFSHRRTTRNGGKTTGRQGSIISLGALE